MGDLFNLAIKYGALRGDQNPVLRDKYFYETKVFARWLLKSLIEADDFKANAMQIDATITRTVDHEGSRLEENRDYPNLLFRFFGTHSDSIDELLEGYGRRWLMGEFYSNYRHHYSL